MIRLVASDMDGTLLDSYRKITDTNIEAIKKLQAQGIEFIINTGREYKNVKEIMDETGIRCGKLCSNGAAGYDEHDKLLFKHAIPKETVKLIFDILRKYHMVPNIFLESGRVSILTKEELEVYVHETMVPAMQVSHPDYVYTKEDFEALVQSTHFMECEQSVLDSKEDVLKIISSSTRTEDLVPLREELKKIPNLAVSYTVPTDVEITVGTAQKGIALMDYVKEKGYEPEEIVAIGDSDNDYSMLSIPGIHSVAMANAAAHINDICVYRTRANTADGIAYIIQCILTDLNNLNLL